MLMDFVYSMVTFVCLYFTFINFCIIYQSLEVFLFDDNDPEEAAYLGIARIPLISLAHDKPIRGTFELKKVKLDNYFSC